MELFKAFIKEETTYCPEDILILDQHSSDISHRSGHIGSHYTGGVGEQKVGSHYHCNIVQRHLVGLLILNYLLKSTQKRLELYLATRYK